MRAAGRPGAVRSTDAAAAAAKRPVLLCCCLVCRGRARRLSPYPVLVLQQAGTYNAIGGQQTIRVKSVRATLSSLLCHLFIGPDKTKMYKALQDEHIHNGTSCEEFKAALQNRLGSTDEPTGMHMVCHRDKPNFAENQPALAEYMTEGTQQPRQPRCLCYNCINLVHLFWSTIGQNTTTGATKAQQASRKRRRGFPNYDG